jgi:mRNA (guanine-N7-)-methyltransferase
VNELSPDAPPQFSNSVYRIRFEERPARIQPFGQRYFFYLEDAVEDVPEYVVHWEHFEK